jgi:hypothetical protein
MERIPENSTFVRVRFTTEATKIRFGFENLLVDPLYHVDANVAARKRLVDLSDYEAISGAFPIKYHSRMPADKQLQLWQLEVGGSNPPASLLLTIKDFPIRVDFVVVLGDSLPSSLSAELNADLNLIATDPDNAFVRVYEQRSSR